MQEVVHRYFERRLNEQKPLPDLIVVDSGKGQLSAAHAALEALSLADRPLISLAKRDEEIFIWGREEPLRLSRRSPGLRLLQQARDEAHRFAVTYNRKRRSMRTVTSELLKVPGIGPVKRRPVSEVATSCSIDGGAGAELSMVTDRELDSALVLPATSVALARMAWWGPPKDLGTALDNNSCQC